MTIDKAAIRVSEWTRDEVSGMKLNADGVCVMSGYEELFCEDKFAVAQQVHYEMTKVLTGTQCDLVFATVYMSLYEVCFQCILLN